MPELRAIRIRAGIEPSQNGIPKERTTIFGRTAKPIKIIENQRFFLPAGEFSGIFAKNGGGGGGGTMGRKRKRHKQGAKRRSQGYSGEVKQIYLDPRRRRCGREEVKKDKTHLDYQHSGKQGQPCGYLGQTAVMKGLQFHNNPPFLRNSGLP
jgi:hypothetical protein